MYIVEIDCNCNISIYPYTRISYVLKLNMCSIAYNRFDIDGMHILLMLLTNWMIIYSVRSGMKSRRPSL